MSDRTESNAARRPDAALTLRSDPASDLALVAGGWVAKRYQVRRIIGQGGVGVVVAAYDRAIGCDVALKFLRPELCQREDVVRGFRVDAMTHARIESPHVVRVHGADSLPDGTPFLIMELLRGCDLRRLVDEHGVLPAERAVDYVLQACEGLAAAHAAGVRHFDLNPSNLFCADLGEESEHIEVIDFGGAPGATSAGVPTCSGDTLVGLGSGAQGSASYEAPEHEGGEQPPDDRSDIWSLGCVLYELIAGEPAFARRQVEARQSGSIIIDESALGPRLDSPLLPPELEPVIRRCLEPDPADRFQDVAELADALLPFASPLSAGASTRCQVALYGAASFRSSGYLSGLSEPSPNSPLAMAPTFTAWSAFGTAPSGEGGSSLLKFAAITVLAMLLATYALHASRHIALPGTAVRADSSRIEAPAASMHHEASAQPAAPPEAPAASALPAPPPPAVPTAAIAATVQALAADAARIPGTGTQARETPSDAKALPAPATPASSPRARPRRAAPAALAPDVGF